MVQNVAMGSEILHLSSDYTVIVRTNLQGGWTGRKDFVFETDRGVKPGNVSKTRTNLSVYASGDVYKKTETYSRTQVVSEITSRLPVTGYSLMSFGTVSKNARYVKANPFGNNTPVLCVAEIQINGVWSNPGFFFVQGEGGYGTAARYTQDEGIIVQTGGRAVVGHNPNGGNGHGFSGTLNSAFCRVHTWRIVL